jgi:hypothetical protein
LRISRPRYFARVCGFAAVGHFSLFGFFGVVAASVLIALVFYSPRTMRSHFAFGTLSNFPKRIVGISPRFAAS